MTIALRRSRTLVSIEDRLPPAPVTRLSDSGAFSPLEQSVIQLSRRDPLSSIADLPGWWRRLWVIVTAGDPKPLANERLEELRRFAILARKLRDPGDEAIDRFLDVGFTLEQAVHVRELVRSREVAAQTQRFNFIIWAILFLIAVGMFVLIRNVIEQSTPSLIAAGVVFVTMASVATPGSRTR